MSSSDPWLINALYAPCLLYTSLVASERQRTASGALAIAVGASIKIFPACAGLFGVLGRDRGRHIGWCVLTGVVLLALPLLITPPDTLLMQYRSWAEIGARDHLHIKQAWIGGIVES